MIAAHRDRAPASQADAIDHHFLALGAIDDLELADVPLPELPEAGRVLAVAQDQHDAAAFAPAERSIAWSIPRQSGVGAFGSMSVGSAAAKLRRRRR